MISKRNACRGCDYLRTQQVTRDDGSDREWTPWCSKRNMAVDPDYPSEPCPDRPRRRKANIAAMQAKCAELREQLREMTLAIGSRAATTAEANEIRKVLSRKAKADEALREAQDESL